jgi:hypothetical protein
MGDVSQADVAQARRYAQPILRLDGQAVSTAATGLVSHCLNEIVLPSQPPQRPSSVVGIRRALEAMIAGLIGAYSREWGDGWVRRPLSHDSFTGEAVGRTQFGKVLTALEAAGLIAIAPGFQDRSCPFGRRRETRLRLTEAGRKLAADYGVTESDVGLHFAKAEG